MQQGGAVEPGLTLFERHLDLVVRADWERTGGANVWGVGAGLTVYGPDPRLRLHAGFEVRTPSYTGADDGSYWAIVRLAVVL
jgi:hypothetical protein